MSDRNSEIFTLCQLNFFFFLQCGRIYEMRLMMDFSGSNRGYMFVRFYTIDEARRAIKELNNYEVR